MQLPVISSDAVVTLVCMASSVALQLSVVPTAVGWVQGGEIKENVLPFVVMAVNNVVGLGFSLKAALWASVAVQAVGAVILCGVIAVLITYSSGPQKDAVMMYTGVAGALLLALGLGSMLAGIYAKLVLGIAAASMSIASSSSPLSAAVSIPRWACRFHPPRCAAGHSPRLAFPVAFLSESHS